MPPIHIHISLWIIERGKKRRIKEEDKKEDEKMLVKILANIFSQTHPTLFQQIFTEHPLCSLFLCHSTEQQGIKTNLDILQ